MKIQARCDTCGRNFLLEQIGPESDTPGRCPFCGARFARHYATVLTDAVRDAEQTATEFAQALAKLQAMETGFDIDLQGAIDELTEVIRAHERPEAS